MVRKIPTLVHLDPELREEVQALARSLNCSASSLLREGLREVLKTKSRVSVHTPDPSARYWAVLPNENTVTELSAEAVGQWFMRGYDLTIMPYDQTSGWTTASALGFRLLQKTQNPETTHGTVAGIEGTEERDSE